MSTPITKKGHAQLCAELERLKNNDRPAIIAAIAEARAHGDLSENAEYHSAKEKQGFIEARIKLLEGALAAAKVIDPSALGGGGRCIFGSVVDLEDDEGKKLSLRIVNEHEVSLHDNAVSHTSPLGRALLGKHEGDEASIEAPSGERVFTLVKVRYE
jgi:transcription elongation factor GreA